MSHARRHLAQALNSTEALGQSEVLAVDQEGFGSVEPARNPEADHTAKRNTRCSLPCWKSVDELLRMRRELPHGELMTRVRSQAGVGDALDG